MNYLAEASVFDIETNGLNPTKIHCLVHTKLGGERVALTTYESMREFLLGAKALIGHNICRYDIPVLEKLLDVSIKAKLVDTLALSWYLEPNRFSHSLDSYGKDYGISKPVVDDWEGLSVEEYVHRCDQDVVINTKLWKEQYNLLCRVYDSEEDIIRFLNYLTFKMDCVREQEAIRWKFDREYCEQSLGKLEPIVAEKLCKLAEAMPEVKTYTKKGRPAKPFKQDGTLSATGVKWFDLLKQHNLPEDYEGIVEVEGKPKQPNPGSHTQIKSWLHSLGWEPQTFKYNRDKETGDVKKIPQVSLTGGGVCESIKLLYDKEPSLAELDDLFVIKHRIGILKGFMRDASEDNYLEATVSGLTNTLRFKHKTVVNLPGTDKPYGKEVRGCLTAPEGMVLCGSDMCSLEDNTKQHYMWEHDPEYVKEMSGSDYDPHTSLAVFAGAMTKEEEDLYKLGEGDVGKMSTIRKEYKAVNYSSVYGIGATALARNLKVSKRKAEKLLEAYWKKNWSVIKIAEDAKVKTVSGQKWLYNPVSKFWYTLRAEKDRWSTLNQGTGVYCFDTWVRGCRKHVKVCGQMHDEIIVPVGEGKEKEVEKVLQDAIKSANITLKLNKPLSVTVQFGNNYSEIH